MTLKEKINQATRYIKKLTRVLYEVKENPKTPLLPKILIIIALAYALSPIDLIPDFIPVLGYCDDLIIVPLLIFISYKLVPNAIWEESYEKALNRKEPLPKNWYGGLIILILWIVISLILMWTLYTRFLST